MRDRSSNRPKVSNDRNDRVATTRYYGCTTPRVELIEVPSTFISTIGVLNLPDEQRVANNSQTLVVDADEFTFETLEQENGQATVVRFALDDPRYHAGDVLLVLSGSEIHFHGMIGSLAEGWATATDRRGSLLAATVQ